MPLLEVTKLVVQLALLALVIYGVAYLRKGVRQLRGEIAAAAIVREALAEEFPDQVPPTDPPGGLTLLHGGGGRAPRKHTGQVAAVAAGLAVVSLVAVAVFANPVVMSRPTAAPKPGPIPDATTSRAPTVQGPVATAIPAAVETPRPTPKATVTPRHPEPTATTTAESTTRPTPTVTVTPTRPPRPKPRKTETPPPAPTVTVPPRLPLPPVTLCPPAPLRIGVCVRK